MTTGIYRINFNNTDKVYIGQSVCIENRILSHLSSLRKGKGAPKILGAYTKYGIKDYDIILECSAEELDEAETDAISIFNSVNNGFNTLESSSVPSNWGISNINAQHIETEYEQVLDLLIKTSPSFSKREIADLTGVSIYIIRHIAALESHQWLKDKFPEKYRILENQKKQTYYTGKQYPQLLSPTGEIVNITHITNFAKQYNLSQPKVSDVLNGHRKSHKGWTKIIS